ncbi:MAG: nuclear transport factor 2 family protein [Woeseiaceae bacterium]|nr:nuclear transport factor 2 family protein [Woeseiaceae bacterium]
MNLRTILLAVSMSAGLAACDQSTTESAGPSQEELNKETVIAFYDAAINDKDFEAASVYLGDKYIQHNPLAADGPEGLKAFLDFARENLSEFKVEFKRVLADGDYVVVHAHAKANPDDRGSAVMDIFRLENGKVVEHWDVIQPIPETAMNDNTMF